MDFHSVMETFAEAWVAANTHTPLTEAAEQGLINGPTTNHAPPQILTVLQDVSNERRDSESITDNDNCRLPGGHQSPDSHHINCTTLSELKSPFKALSNPHGKSLPVHCIIEQIPGPQTCGQYVELDSYAIVPNETLFSDLVRTALGKLGYSGAQILGAKGSIQIKKWKPLAFDQITENPEATVADILGELSTVASLHVRLYSVPDNPQEWIDTTVRNAVLELLREMSQSKLAKLCPLSQPMLSNIINNRYMGKIGKEKCQEFGLWYLSYRKQHPEGSTPEVVPNDRPLDGRLTFHPTKELPIMRDWFHGCRNPSRRTLQMYVDILNQGPVRQQERPKIALSTLKNWWKNEKQRERKNQKSQDTSIEPSKPKRKKKSNSQENVNEPSSNANLNNELNSEKTSAPNKFTLINHAENELEQYSAKEEKSNDNMLKYNEHHEYSSLSQDVDSNLKFTMLNNSIPVNDVNNYERKENEIVDTRINANSLDTSKDSSDAPLFHKLQDVCMDSNHNGMYGFSDSTLQEKVYCDNPSERTSIMDTNGHTSSEEDVDVGI